MIAEDTANKLNVLAWTRLTVEGDAVAAPKAARMTSCWAGPLGAVSALERPSWLTAAPRSRNANITLAPASDCVASSIAPQASALRHMGSHFITVIKEA